MDSSKIYEVVLLSATWDYWFSEFYGVEQHHRTPSVPKFGAWDELDPESGEGFTAIFNKVKEEKQIASSQFPNVSPQPSYYPSAQRHGRSSSRSKVIYTSACEVLRQIQISWL